jgi:hypothetical protein
VSLLAASMAPADLRFVARSRSGEVWINLYYFGASVHMDFILCFFVSVRRINVGLVWVFIMWWRSRIVLCMPFVLNATALMGECLYIPLSCVSCCVFVWWFVCDSSVSCCVRFTLMRVQICIVLVLFVCIWSCSLVGCGGACR